MALSADLLRGYTDSIILRRLAERDNYGYQINKEAASISGGAFELKEATLYTAFRRLESAGLIRSYWGDEQSGARRRYYAITMAGEERLRADQEAWMETRGLINALLLEDHMMPLPVMPDEQETAEKPVPVLHRMKKPVDDTDVQE